MPTPKKTTSRRSTSRRTTTRRRVSAKEPAAIKRLNKSLDGAESALVALRKDVQSGAGDAYKNLRQLVRNARRDSGKLSKAIQKDLEEAAKAVRSRAGGGSTARRATARRSPARRSPARKTTARRKPAARRSAAKR